MGDDQPYLLHTPKGDLVELPSETANDDWTHYAHVPDLEYTMQIRAPQVAEEVYRAEFEAAISTRRSVDLGLAPQHLGPARPISRC